MMSLKRKHCLILIYTRRDLLGSGPAITSERVQFSVFMSLLKVVAIMETFFLICIDKAQQGGDGRGGEERGGEGTSVIKAGL